MTFTVLICLYKSDAVTPFLDAFKSVLEQTLLPQQIVVVCDGPIPSNLRAALDSCGRKASEAGICFTPVSLKVNRGHGYARKVGVQNSQCDFIAIVDSDDVNSLNRFELQVKFLKQNPNVSVLGGRMVEFDSVSKNVLGAREVATEHAEIVNYMRSRCPFNQMTVMFRKEDVIMAGNYRTFFHNEDYYLWIRMEQNGCVFHNLQSVLVNARVNLDSYRRRGGWKYFRSETKIQGLLFKTGHISFFKYIGNVFLRFSVQIILPPNLRSWFFQQFARS